jgi:tetratricopeptide (TPR) repeat protein
VISSNRSAGILVAAVVVNIWLVYSGPRNGDVPGLWPFIVLVIAATPLFLHLLNRATPGSGARYAAVFGVAWFGVNPAITATLVQPNTWKIICATLGMILAMLLYQWQPAWRRWGFFLLPTAAAALCHQVTLAFGALLFAYIFLFEEDGHWTALPRAVVRSLPAVIVSLLALRLPPLPPDGNLAAKIAQGGQTLAAFLAPWAASGSLGQDAAAVATIFLVILAGYCAIGRHTRAVSFGLWWFLAMTLAAPSEPLPAVIGLALASAAIVARAVALAPRQELRLIAAGCMALVLLCGVSVVQRNVQAFEGATLIPAQAAATPIQPPANAPPAPLPAPIPGSDQQKAEQWLGQSVALYREKKFPQSIAAAQEVLKLNPNSAEAFNNIAAAHAEMQQWDQAIAAAVNALRIRPDFPLASNNLRWALQGKRESEGKK